MARTFSFEAGLRYGSFTTLEKVASTRRNVWKVRCDCGKTKNILATYLVRGRIKTCGCGLGIAARGKGRYEDPRLRQILLHG